MYTRIFSFCFGSSSHFLTIYFPLPPVRVSGNNYERYILQNFATQISPGFTCATSNFLPGFTASSRSSSPLLSESSSQIDIHYDCINCRHNSTLLLTPARLTFTLLPHSSISGSVILVFTSTLLGDVSITLPYHHLYVTHQND